MNSTKIHSVSQGFIVSEQQELSSVVFYRSCVLSLSMGRRGKEWCQNVLAVLFGEKEKPRFVAWA